MLSSHLPKLEQMRDGIAKEHAELSARRDQAAKFVADANIQLARLAGGHDQVAALIEEARGEDQGPETRDQGPDMPAAQ